MENNALIINPSGPGEFVLVCEHATNYMPSEFDGLGLPEVALQSHIAWDPGALPVAEALAGYLDCPLVVPQVSRLIIDCNRLPDVQSAMPELSEAYCIPGNKGLTEAERNDRSLRFYYPFHRALDAILERKLAASRSTTMLTVHSFNPVFNGVKRREEIGLIHDADARFAEAFRAILSDLTHLRVDLNAPYGPDDGVTHTLQRHGTVRGLPNIMVEIRNDLITTPKNQDHIATMLAKCVQRAMRCRNVASKNR